MQHYIQFALLLMLATVHLTSAAVSTVSTIINGAYTLFTFGGDRLLKNIYVPVTVHIG